MYTHLLAMMLLFYTFTTPQGIAASEGFKTPSGNIACEVYDDILRCDLQENMAKTPKAPVNCELDWGNMFTLSLQGKGKRLCAGDTVFGHQKTLAYGKTWKNKGFVCVSAATGLTCKNRKNHGWTLNKRAQKLF